MIGCQLLSVPQFMNPNSLGLPESRFFCGGAHMLYGQGRANVCVCVCLFVYLSLCLSVSLCLPVCPSLSVWLSVCLSLCLSPIRATGWTSNGSASHLQMISYADTGTPVFARQLYVIYLREAFRMMVLVGGLEAPGAAGKILRHGVPPSFSSKFEEVAPVPPNPSPTRSIRSRGPSGSLPKVHPDRDSRRKAE